MGEKDLLIKNSSLDDVLKNSKGTCRLVKELKDGRYMILQIVDPSKDGFITKWLRKKAEDNKAIKLAHALEVAQRVGGYAFRSAMRKGKKNE